VIQGGSGFSGFGGSSASSSPNPGVGVIANLLESRGETVHRVNSGEIFHAVALDTAAAQRGEPVHIVGHSWGGDTAVDVAWALHQQNTRVTTLVTIDSVGLNNTTIPPNVGLNLNYYQNKTPILRGGENRALDPTRTRVGNIYRPNNTHFNIDDAQDIQQQIRNQILGGRK